MIGDPTPTVPSGSLERPFRVPRVTLQGPSNFAEIQLEGGIMGRQPEIMVRSKGNLHGKKKAFRNATMIFMEKKDFLLLFKSITLNYKN